jgi:hypothetical protein
MHELGLARPFSGGGELFDLNDMVAEARAEVGDLSDELDTHPLPDLSPPPCLVSRKSEREICPAQSGGRLHFYANDGLVESLDQRRVAVDRSYLTDPHHSGALHFLEHFSAILLAHTAGGINNVARTNACPFYSWPSRLL